jgi:hypothetical protein
MRPCRGTDGAHCAERSSPSCRSPPSSPSASSPCRWPCSWPSTWSTTNAASLGHVADLTALSVTAGLARGDPASTLLATESATTIAFYDVNGTSSLKPLVEATAGFWNPTPSRSRLQTLPRPKRGRRLARAPPTDVDLDFPETTSSVPDPAPLGPARPTRGALEPTPSTPSSNGCRAAVGGGARCGRGRSEAPSGGRTRSASPWQDPDGICHRVRQAHRARRVEA